MGRPSDYTPEIAAEICVRLSDGESLRSICEEEGMPDRKTVFRWVGQHEEFSRQYAHARSEQSEAFADDIQAIADNPTGDVQRDKLRIDTRKWIASKLKPKKYGDKIEVEHAGSVKHVTQLTDEELERIAAMGKKDEK